MALNYLGLDIMIAEDHVQRLDRRIERQLLRIAEDPFDLTNNEFKELYRLSPDLIFNLIDALEPRLQRTRITGLSVEKQVIQIVVTIYFLCFIVMIILTCYLNLFMVFNYILYIIDIVSSQILCNWLLSTSYK